MKALVFHGPKTMRVESVEDPGLKAASDVIVRVTSTAICGSDLHIYNGFLPQTKPMILGHEFMGIVEEVGRDVKKVRPGDRVFVPFPIACGSCFFCTHEMPHHCDQSNVEHYGPDGGVLDEKGGAIFGYTDLYGGVVHLQTGSIAALRTAVSAVRRGGVISVVGVYGLPYDNFPLGQMFDKGVTLRMGQAPVHTYLDTLLDYVVTGRVRLDDIITHRLPLEDGARAFQMFCAKQDNCLKVVLKP
jgi:threonine dehydrogenase-like Zn-dependent dehydrogenase